MNCTNCNNELKQSVIKGIIFLYCEKCDGVWITFDNLKKLSKMLNLKNEIINPLTMEEIKLKEEIKNCPSCKDKMHKTYFNGVALDCCKQCNAIFFDSYELSRFFKLFMKIPPQMLNNKDFISFYAQNYQPSSEKQSAILDFNPQNKEKPAFALDGYFMCVVAIAAIIIAFMLSFTFPFLAIPLFLIVLFIIRGFRLLKPQEAFVLTVFGKYTGTLKGAGFYYVNPFAQNTNRTMFTPISLKAMTLQNNKQKINDELGNPIEVSIVVVWKVDDTAKAMFNVEDYSEFLSVQSDSALRTIVRMYPYDASDDSGKQSLRGDSQEISEKLKTEIQKNVRIAGINVIDAKITHLAYAPEIAVAMLQRQQASAIIDAKKAIVEGAVSTVEMAIDRLTKNNSIVLTDEQKTKMVNNLLVILCSNKEIQPTIPTF